MTEKNDKKHLKLIKIFEKIILSHFYLSCRKMLGYDVHK